MEKWDEFMEGLGKACSQVGAKPNAISDYFHFITHLKNYKSDYKDMIVNGKLNDTITEAEYKCEGER